MTRPQVLTDTALEVLARQGSRGLTHRAVDAAAGLPPGSTSYYYRSRSALLIACVGRLVERDHADLDAMAPLLSAADPTALADALGDLLCRWLTTDRGQHLARYELTLESLRRPELATELHQAGHGLRLRISEILAGFGASDPARQARWLVACIDGILFDSIAGALAHRSIDPAEIRAGARELITMVTL